MTRYGICELSVVPVRKQPSDKSEMINQLLFGDAVIIQESQGNWLLISTSHDNYEGWIDNKQISIIPKEEYISYGKSQLHYVSANCALAYDDDGLQKQLVIGSKIAGYSNGKFNVCGNKYSIDDNSVVPPGTMVKSIINTGYKFIGSPYMWGGRSPMGIDCSGFVQVVYGMHGISLPRDAYLQAEIGTTVDFINESQPGDLAYFDNEEESIIHVGIIINENRILHASGEVRIDSIDHQGIYNESVRKYTHKLRIIKRVI